MGRKFEKWIGCGVVCRCGLVVVIGLRPEQPVWNNVAHAGSKTGIETTVKIGQRFLDRFGKIAAGSEQGRQSRGQGIAGAGESCFETLETAAVENGMR